MLLAGRVMIMYYYYIASIEYNSDCKQLNAAQTIWIGLSLWNQDEKNLDRNKPADLERQQV